MKKFFFIALICAASYANAQSPSDCFMEYYELFTQRGCDPIPDGVHNVIITVRDTQNKTCFAGMGTIEVKNGKIAGKLQIKNRAGGYSKPKRELHEGYNDPDHKLQADYSIKNGISRNFLSKDMKVVNVFFLDFLKGREKAPAIAPAAKNL